MSAVIPLDPRTTAVVVQESAWQPVDLGRFLNMEIPQRGYLLKPWLPEQGLVMVYAARGVGKTHFALATAYAVACGGSFLNGQAPQAEGVLYLDGEMPAIAMQERLAAIAAGSDKEPTAPFRLLTPDLCERMPNMADPDDQHALEPLLTDIKLIVLDNVSTLCRGAPENEADGWQVIQDWMLSQRKQGRSVLLVHHAGRSGEARGTSKREDVLDTVIKLRHPADYRTEDGARFELQFSKARGFQGKDAEPLEAKLITGTSGESAWVWQTVEVTTYDRVVKMLREGMKQQDIATELVINKSTVSRHARRAEQEGRL
ncbi:MAG: AAA family ATPase [Nevskiales bacterium]